MLVRDARLQREPSRVCCNLVRAQWAAGAAAPIFVPLMLSLHCYVAQESSARCLADFPHRSHIAPVLSHKKIPADNQDSRRRASPLGDERVNFRRGFLYLLPVS